MFARKEALEAGAETYHGSPCRHCGGTERRTSNHVCLPCNSAYVKAYKAERRAIAHAGHKTYLGKPCRTCGSHVRRMSNGDCQKCYSARSVERIAAMKAGRP